MKNQQNIMKVAMLTFGTIAFTACSSKSQHRHGNEEHRGRPSAAELITEMDEDKDGKLAETEVKGRLKDNFAEVDADRDGFITEEELENAPKPEGRPPRGER